MLHKRIAVLLSDHPCEAEAFFSPQADQIPDVDGLSRRFEELNCRCWSLSANARMIRCADGPSAPQVPPEKLSHGWLGN